MPQSSYNCAKTVFYTLLCGSVQQPQQVVRNSVDKLVPSAHLIRITSRDAYAEVTHIGELGSVIFKCLQ